ncbi:MAG: nucleotidyl transferase AbiEii/AbiGii toxin family protein [Phycisphaerae bacterium]|nr:nucleotidyl transferase AbiEii/AbiGii toxin family protein [Phycisphaerae bacterium]
MDNTIFNQLSELAQACRRIDVKPIICGGLGIYLSFCKKDNEIQQMIRATQDIDLMLSKQDLLEESKRKAIDEIITHELEYIVQPEKKYHGFKKGLTQELDILVPPIEELPRNNYRLKIVKSSLHGHITAEAEFIDEDLRTVRLSDILEDCLENKEAVLYVPSPTNLMTMKLFAFNDRNQGDRKTPDRAMAHAWDMYITVMLTDINDLKEGQVFLSRHGDSRIIQKTKSIIGNYFSQYEKAGWQTVLSSSNFYPALRLVEKEEKLKQSAARLIRWFDI